MQIIPAITLDEPDIKALLHACELPSKDLDTSHLEHFFVIKENGQVVGCVGLEMCADFGLLRSLALRESLRGRGLGAQLVEHIEGYAASRQINTLYLLTITAESFFIHIGYQVVPRESTPEPIQETADFQNICPESAVCLFRKLNPSRRDYYAS